ncbi:MAG: ribonuclease HII [Deltaproteobacteria bacterium]|nr:ribonuclease HII [Deltaproteobacteria bacterium]
MGIDQWRFENQARRSGLTRIAGVDEAGRGPLAGPVVSAAVILPFPFPVSGVTDSKKLTPKKRQVLYHQIYEHADAIGIGIVDPGEIDRTNILKASLLSMVMAVNNLSPMPEHVLIDGIFSLPVSLSQEAIPKGDALSISIGAASIIAKVTRDSLMERYHEDYPDFGFAIHKGYPTPFHKEAIRLYGCSPIHRKSFKGVKERADHGQFLSDLREK